MLQGLFYVGVTEWKKPDLISCYASYPQTFLLPLWLAVRSLLASLLTMLLASLVLGVRTWRKGTSVGNAIGSGDKTH